VLLYEVVLAGKIWDIVGRTATMVAGTRIYGGAHGGGARWYGAWAYVAWAHAVVQYFVITIFFDFVLFQLTKSPSNPHLGLDLGYVRQN